MRKLLPIAAALAAGAVNGLLGTGGGIILILFLEASYRKSGGEKSFKQAVTATLACTVTMSAASSVIYAIRGNIDFFAALPYLPAGVVGGAAGGLLLSKISPPLLRKIFALLVIFCGIRMLIRA